MASRTQPPKPRSSGLTDQQILFCRIYAQTLNAGRSYREAGYKVSSDASARAHGARLVANGNIRAYLGEVCDLDEVSVINAVTAIALTPITEVIQWDGKELIVKQSEQWSDRAKLAVKKVKARTRTIPTESGEPIVECDIEVEMHDRLSALDKLMRKMKLYPRDNDPVLEANGSESGKSTQQRQQEIRDIVLSEVLGIDEDITDHFAEPEDEVAFAVPIEMDTRSQ